MSGPETAERRQVTVLHCDIVNSTAMVERLDPEEVLAIMQEYLDRCRALVEEFHGILAGYTGDGFEAYFGYPVAREESAADALNAGVRIVRMLAEWDSQRAIGLVCRTGIATGRVVIAQPGIPQVGRTVVAFGATPHLAARLEKFAKPGKIFVDNATRRLCESRFSFLDVGYAQFKGFDSDVKVWEVVEERRPGQRFNYSKLSPYVGRHEEIQLLISRWNAAMAGKGQVVLIHGDPGIGKSRLVYELQKALPGNSGNILQFQCSSQHTSTPLHPWIHSVQRSANIQSNDNADEKLSKLTEYLQNELGFSMDVVNTCANLMGLKQGDPESPLERSPQTRLTMLQNRLVDYFVTLSQDRPILILLEDIQWIDASTLNLLGSMVELASREKILLIMTCRSGQVPSFNYTHVTSLSLTKLDNSLVTQLIAKLTSTDSQILSEKASSMIHEKSDGNPLFVEELTKHYLEIAEPGSSTDELGAREDLVPDVLQGSLMERIDKAEKGKEIAQLASVIGREFDRDVLVALSEESHDTMQQILDELTDLDILQRLNHGQRELYEFRHALLRDAVYSGLLHSTRTRIHAEIAAYFARDWGAVQTVPPEIIAYHYECGDDRQNAFRFWLVAGQKALRAGATKEAADLLAKSLKLSTELEETRRNLEDQAAMYLAYGYALNASLGVIGEPIEYYRKSEELATRLQDTEMTLEALDWQFGIHFNAGELLASKEPAQKMKRLGLNLGHRTATASGCQALGMSEFMQGHFVEARKEFEQGLEAAGQRVSGAHCYPSMSLSYLAWTLFVLGEDANAESCADRAIESARRESSHAMATALSNCCYVYQCMGSVDKVYTCTDELMEHTRKYGELIYLKRGIIIRNWADSISDRSDRYLGEMEENIESLLRSKEEIEVTFLLGVLAELQIEHEQYSDARSSLDRAMDLVGKNDESFYLAELYRLKARLAGLGPETVSTGDGPEHLAMARRIAEEQQAKAWLDRLKPSSRRSGR